MKVRLTEMDLPCLFTGNVLFFKAVILTQAQFNSARSIFLCNFFALENLFLNYNLELLIGVNN